MYTEVPKITTLSALALQIHVWMVSTKGLKPNDKTVPVYLLSLYTFEQNKSFSMENSIGWSNLVL